MRSSFGYDCMMTPFALLITQISSARVAFSMNTGAKWTGDMHPQIGFSSNPNCNLTTLQNCHPTYETLNASGKLWKCPLGHATKSTCSDGTKHTCSPGSGGNPLCNLSEVNPCCCPKDGCFAENKFNQIIGVCKGLGCACESASAPSCGDGTCGNKCTGEIVPCCFGNDVSALEQYYKAGSKVVLNYMAAYQFDDTVDPPVWRISSHSSFNTDGRFPAYDLMKEYGGLPKEKAWLAPQPGGAMFWSLGYYAAGVEGVGGSGKSSGGGGAMFVLSSEQFWGATWYMLNTLTMDRGPAGGRSDCSVTGDNCWASGNAGEMDFLEPSWSKGNATTTDEYRASYSTQWNQIGRCFNGGVNGGGFGSANMILTSGETKPEPIVYVAVVDSVGNYVYRIPASQVEEVWPGLGRKIANETLRASPAVRPAAVNPCKEGYCFVFTSNCQATNWVDANAQNCGFNRDQGFCGNWMAELSDTKQPLFPGDNCTKDIRGGKTMPWCKEMVGMTGSSDKEHCEVGWSRGRFYKFVNMEGGWA